MPPHNIHATGVGPYELAARLQETLALLPSDQRRVELFKVAGLFDYRLLRTDGDALVIGVGRRTGVDFISVLDPDIARTESGVGVGAAFQELVATLGAEKVPKGVVRDARLVTFESLPNTRFIVERGKALAAVIASPPEVRPDDPAVLESEGKDPDAGCRAQRLLERRDELEAIAKLGPAASVSVGCLVSEGGEAVVSAGDMIRVIAADVTGRLRVIASRKVPGLDFVALLEQSAERSDLYVVAQRLTLEDREVVVSRFRLNSGRLQNEWERIAFRLKATAAAWIGAEIRRAHFMIELRGTESAIEIGGIFVVKDRKGLRNVVPLKTIELPTGRSPRKARTEAITPDAGVVERKTNPKAVN